jgi:hypothetical protein
MIRFALVLAMLSSMVVSSASTSGRGTAATIYFDESAPDMIVLGNSAHYEIGIRKANGSIAYVTDKTTGQRVTLGSRYECLWGTVYRATDTFVGGCQYNGAWADTFDYAWSASSHTLTLYYTAGPASAQRITAQALLRVSEEPWFDLQLHVQNNTGHVLDEVLFPCDTVFLEADIQEALLPILPGVVLESGFFAQHRSYGVNYPGWPGMFADYASLVSAKGRIAMYTMSEDGLVQPGNINFHHDDQYVPDSYVLSHVFFVRLAADNEWTTPRVRVRIGQSPPDTLWAYRVDNGLDRFADLRAKLGSRYDQVAQSVLLKADAGGLGVAFAQYPALLARLPSPGIFHTVAYEVGGFDQNYPDFLPPAPAWGTTADFAAMFRQAQARGLLVMPYTNPTWWDDESPTLRNLPPTVTITDVAVLDEQGAPMYEYYGPNGGYVVSPYAPFVQQRLEQLVNQMTVQVPSDLLFEDQVGARFLAYDHNAASPYPAAYLSGWLEHTRAYSDTLLMTEMGFDRLAETEAGFHGSVLLLDRRGEPDGWWGVGNWHYYPLAIMLARDKVLFYQHDLAPETYTKDKATLAWNMAMGYMLSYDLYPSEYGGGLDSPWLGVAAPFQKHVLSLYASERILGYTNLQDKVTQTSFETYTCVRNWDETKSYTSGDHVLPPQGAVTRKNDGTVVAGVFIGYNGCALSSGDHYLIEERKPSEILVRQPLGTNTNLTLRWLVGWRTTAPVLAEAYAEDGSYLGEATVTVSMDEVTFYYQRTRGGQTVAYYRLYQPESTALVVYLPLLRR